jgi:hypothetical protein
MKRLLGTLLFASAMMAATAANAGNYFGTIWLVQNTGTPGTLRFMTVSGPTGVSLFATGDYKETMLQGFYKKAKMSIGYTALSPCPGGLSGTCGTVASISVDTSGF